jgi:hypothetical protein
MGLENTQVHNGHPVISHTAEQLKKEIDALVAIQKRSLQAAIYLGMMSAEAHEIEARRKTITHLTDELAELKSPK